MISKQALFAKTRELCASGWHELQSKGSGAPGTRLEEFLGLKAANYDGPDAGLWELKFSSGRSILTLFHKTPRPKNVVKDIIRNYGWEGSNGKPSFRHTIRGESERGFKIVHDSIGISVRHQDGSTVAHWTTDDLLNSAGSKLRRLLLVTGKLRTQNGVRQVMYEHATSYEQFKLSRFMDAIESGLVAVDFDAYIKESGVVRDHGTKFRIDAGNLGKLYEKRQAVA